MTRVIITFQGIETVIGNLSRIEQRGLQNAEQIMSNLGKDSLEQLKTNTPERTGVLRGGDTLTPETLGFTLYNRIKYAGWVERGHRTPAGWRTKRGYRRAKRQSYVEGRRYMQKTVSWIAYEIRPRLSKFLEG